MAKKLLSLFIVLAIGLTGGFYFGFSLSSSHYQDRKQLVTHVRQFEQANNYVKKSLVQGTSATKALVLDDLYFHLLGARLYTPKVPDQVKSDACQILKSSSVSPQQLSKFAGTEATVKPELIELLKKSEECLAW